MPELPEVEIVCRALQRRLIGRTIVRVRASRPCRFFLTPPSRLRRVLAGRRCESLTRAGKYLLLGLDDGARLLLHLGMTGQLLVGREADVHTHLVLELDRGLPLVFRDVRGFGRVQWLARGQDSERIAKLGVDALQATAEHLRAASARRRIPIKTLLLDQRVLSGIGNIYADEALFMARVRPQRRADQLKPAEHDAIVTAAKAVMLRAIDVGGSSISDYLHPDGRRGHFQDERRVYARAGQPCAVCGTAIERRVIAARSSHYCRVCQR